MAVSLPLPMAAPWPWTARLTLVAGLLAGPALMADAARADLAGLVASEAASRAVQIALETKPSGSAYTWQSVDGLVAGKVTLRRTFRTTEGYYCREYGERVTDGADTMAAIHIACREPDGTWVVAEE
jgi:surface antigen